MSDKSWALGPMCAWDTETTGVDTETARIVTSAVVTIRPGESKQVVEWLINPGVQIPDAAAEVHGVTTEKAREVGLPAAGAVAAIGEALMAAVAAHYGVPLSEEEAHTAYGDCLATARVAYKLAKQYPKVAAMELAALHEFQKESHFEWAEGFEEYLRRKDKDAVVDRSWPLRPVAEVSA